MSHTYKCHTCTNRVLNGQPCPVCNPDPPEQETPFPVSQILPEEEPKKSVNIATTIGFVMFLVFLGFFIFYLLEVLFGGGSIPSVFTTPSATLLPLPEEDMPDIIIHPVGECRVEGEVDTVTPYKVEIRQMGETLLTQFQTDDGKFVTSLLPSFGGRKFLLVCIDKEVGPAWAETYGEGFFEAIGTRPINDVTGKEDASTTSEGYWLFPNPEKFRPQNPTPTPGGSGPAPTSTWTPFTPPTATPMPTVAEIPTLMPSTLMPHQDSLENFTPEPTAHAAIATAKADAMQQNCVTVVQATNFWDLDDLPFWSQGVTYLEFRLGESGAYAMSNHVGGNGPDAYKRWACVRQVLNWPGGNINLGNGITGTWNGAQARKSPMYGIGDWISNGMECGANGLWLFQCTVTYPPGTPTPTPQMPPTATPRATISLAQMISLFQQYNWSMQQSCQADGSTILIKIGGTCSSPDNPSYWVDFSPVWDRYQGGTIWIGPCVQLSDPKFEWNDTGKCISPFK